MTVDTTLADSDEGNRVIDSRGDEIERVVEVRGDSAYVSPDPWIGDTIWSKLGWNSPDEDYRLKAGHVDTVTGEEIRLRDRGDGIEPGTRMRCRFGRAPMVALRA